MNQKEEHKKYYIYTFGCQMNEFDSEVMAGILEEMGFYLAEKEEDADIIIINTCCVRETAENKVYGLLGRLSRLKKAKPDLLIGVGGCMTQREDVARKIRDRFSHVNFIFGTCNLSRLADLIKNAKENKRAIIELSDRAHLLTEKLPVKRTSKIRAWVVITHGCNNFCSYCIVPYVRGREYSRSPEHILTEIKNMVKEGYKEVILLGQNVNSYSRDSVDFAELLTEVNKINGLERIRFTTSHPRDFSFRLIKVIAGSDKICEHVHLPVQAGSNSVLYRMKRGYTRGYYLDLIDKIRQIIPGVAITTDIMVGFPGESDEDFAQTLDLVERVRFDSAFMFIYNIRPGTSAALMPDQIPDEIKKERIKILIEKQNSISKEINLKEVGKIHQILVEGVSKTNPDLLSGRTRTNKLVTFSGSSDLTGKLVNIYIKNAKLTHLEGQWVE